MKKLLATALILAMSVGVLSACGSGSTTTDTATDTTADTTTEAGVDSEIAISVLEDWTVFDDLIASIMTETDLAVREEMMHEAEDILMDSGALLPIYYYVNTYMVKDYVEGLYTSVYGHMFFREVEVEGNVLNAHLASEPAYLDPTLNSSSDGASLAKMAFSGLYTSAADGSLVPDAATGYTVSDDSLTYTFTLNEGMVWSDGSTFDATDFVYTWNRAVAEETAADYGYMFDIVARNDDGTLQVESSEDGLTLTVTLNSPCAYFLDLCAFTTYLPVHQESIEACDGWETNPGLWAQEAGFVSNGPFMLESWTHDESMVYVKNETYHDADSISLEQVNLMLSADDSVVYAAYEAGNLDVISSVPTDMVSTLLDNSEFKVDTKLGTYYACFNVNSPIFEGKTEEQAAAMRIAISWLLDRDYIIGAVTQAGEVAATSFIPAEIQDGQGEEFKQNDDAYTYPVEDEAGYVPSTWSQDNVDYAIALLEFAGFEFDENGMLSAETPLTLEYLTNEGTAHVAVAEAMQQDLALVGITMTITETEWNVFLEERKAGNFDFARNGWISDFNDPINMLEMWTTDSGNNDAQLGK